MRRELAMLLEKKIAVVYGAGAVGTAVAQAFAREGAWVFLAGRNNAVGHDHLQGNAIVDLSPRQFVDPLSERMLGQFLTRGQRPGPGRPHRRIVLRGPPPAGCP